MEALANGYTEGIALDHTGNLSEGSGENIFVVRENVLYTTFFAAAILPGVTRATVIALAEKLKIKVVETQIPREMLYIADEVFFTGTAAEITPIRSIDKIVVGEGKAGELTKSLQKEFFKIVSEGKDPYRWLTYIDK